MAEFQGGRGCYDCLEEILSVAVFYLVGVPLYWLFLEITRADQISELKEKSYELREENSKLEEMVRR
jgi:hypothetical protein